MREPTSDSKRESCFPSLGLLRRGVDQTSNARPARQAVAVVGIVVTGLLAGVLLVGPTGAATTCASPASSRCKVEVEKDAAPETLILGDETELTLTVRADCSGAELPAHVALVFDNSTYMGGQRMNDMKSAVSAFGDAIDWSVSRVGLASYSGRVKYLAELTDDPEELTAASEDFFPETGSDLTRALAAGRLMLDRGRDLAAVDDYIEAIVLFVGSPNTGDEGDLVAQAAALRDEGTLVVAVAATSSADLELLEQIATAPTFFHIETMSTRYPLVMQQIAAGLSSVQAVGADVIDVLPDNMEYVWGSGVPVPRIEGQELRWRYDVWPAEGITITYALEPLELGCHATNASAEVEVRFDRGEPQKHSFPVPSVCAVSAPSETPVGPTPVPSPTHTPRSHRLYLPVLWRGYCAPPPVPADVVIVIDTSSSMMAAAAGGVPRAQLVQSAASRLVDELDLDIDRAAVVAASARSNILVPLTGDRGALQTAIAGAFRTMKDDSVLAPAVADAAGLLELQGGARSATPAVVVFTDGFDDPEAATRESETAIARGWVLFALGLGAEVDPEALATLAGGLDRHVWSQDGSGLADASLELVDRLHCGLPAD